MHTVSVRKLVIDCAVPHDHPNPLAVRTRLDDAAQRIGVALGMLLGPLDKLGDEIIVIPKLELAFELDTSLEPADLAARWAARIAAAIAAWLRPEAQTTLLRFPSEAHYLARFLVDTASGHAQDKWYYRRWQGIAALATAAQLRSALVEDPARGIAALAALPAAQLTLVVGALGAREARRVVEACAASTAADLDRAAIVLAPGVAAWLPIAAGLPSPWQAALVLAARAPNAAREDTAALVTLAATLAVIVHRRAQRAAATDPVMPLESMGLPGPSALLALSPPARRALLEPLGETQDPAADELPETWYTRLGGLLLLLPRIAELPLDALFGDEAGIARLLVLSRAAGEQHRDEVLRDPLWRRLCGVDAEVDLDAWLPRAAELAPSLWERAMADAEQLHAVVTRHDTPWLVLSAQPTGEWLGITALSPEVRSVLRGPRILVEDHELTAHATHGAAHRAARMLAWLGADLEAPADLALALAAQHVLRAFARRLPGFAESSPRFLYDSFLDFDATILDAGDAFHCRVGRPRLVALFGLTGALRGRLSIGDGRVLELHPE